MQEWLILLLLPLLSGGAALRGESGSRPVAWSSSGAVVLCVSRGTLGLLLLWADWLVSGMWGTAVVVELGVGGSVAWVPSIGILVQFGVRWSVHHHAAAGAS